MKGSLPFLYRQRLHFLQYLCSHDYLIQFCFVQCTIEIRNNSPSTLSQGTYPSLSFATTSSSSSHVAAMISNGTSSSGSLAIRSVQMTTSSYSTLFSFNQTNASYTTRQRTQNVVFHQLFGSFLEPIKVTANTEANCITG